MGTPVLAAAFGHVQRVGTSGQYGTMIELSHGNGFVTRYAHLSRTDVVVGQRAPRGMKIGEVRNRASPSVRTFITRCS